MKFSWLTNNLGAKILCVLLAAGLWFYIANDGFQTQKASGGVTIRPVNLSDQLAVVENLGEVELSIRPATGLRKSVTAAEFDAYVDVAGLNQGSYELPVKVSANDTELQVLDITPSKIKVTLDKRVAKTFSVKAAITGTAGDGYNISDSEITPDEVVVAGAESLVGTVESVVAEVALNNDRASVRRSVELRALNDNGEEVRNIYITPKTAEINVPIAQERDVKTVGVKIKTINQPKAGYFVKSLTADPSTVTLRGQRRDLDAIEYAETKDVDLKDLSANSDKKVELNLPDGVTIDGKNSIKITITVDSAETTLSVPGVIEFKNLNPDLKVESFSPTKAAVTVRGKGNRLAALTERDVHVIVDLAGKGEGTFTVTVLPVNVDLPDGVTLESLDSKEFQVFLKVK